MTPYKLEPLPYGYGALEPHMDTTTVQIHYEKHLGNYVANLNRIIAEYDYKNLPEDITEFIAGIRFATINSSDREALIFNAGGVANHKMFFNLLNPQREEDMPSEKLFIAINSNFGSFEKFREDFMKTAQSQMGSGWAWLCIDCDSEGVVIKDKHYPRLFISSTLNHDNPSMIGIVKNYGKPILCLDLWEHAYYLKHQNRKSNYFDDFWKLLDWKKVAEYYAKETEGLF